MGYKYVVFGAGRQGLAAVYDLILNCEADEVLVVEPDEATGKAAQQRLAELLPERHGRVDFATKGVPTGEAATALRQFDVILGCAPYATNPGLTVQALEAGVPFCDLGGNPETVAEQERLCGIYESQKACVPVVPDCGVSPGLSNILAAALARRGCDRIRVRCGGLPLDENQPGGMPDPTWSDSGDFNYKLVFSPMGLLSEYGGWVPVIQEGKVLRTLAIGITNEPFQWGECRLEAAPTSNNSPQAVARLRDLGVKDYNYMTLRYPGHWDLVRGWMAAGFLLPSDPEGVRAGDEALAAQLAANWRLKHGEGDRDRLILSVQGSEGVAGSGLRKHSGFSVEVWSDTKTGFTAMELTTSWGITTVAHQMASGVARPTGFATPERFSDGDWIFGQIEKRVAQLEGQPE